MKNVREVFVPLVATHEGNAMNSVSESTKQLLALSSSTPRARGACAGGRGRGEGAGLGCEEPTAAV